MSSDDPDKFYVLYCCPVCHFQCNSKDTLWEHRKSCQQTGNSKNSDSAPAISSPKEQPTSPGANNSLDEVTSADTNISCVDGEFGFKITNVCSMAPEPTETEIDGFEMECEEIEEERQSDVEESDGETTPEPVTSHIIIPQTPVTTKAKYMQKTTKTTSGQTVIYVSPDTASTNNKATTQMCTVINSDGVTTLMPQSIVPSHLEAKGNIPVVLQQQASKYVSGSVSLTKTAAPEKTTTASPKSGVKLVTVNPLSKETKVLYIPAGGLTTASATPTVNLSALNTGSPISQPASVMNQNAKLNMVTIKPENTTTPQPNMVSLITSKPQEAVTTTTPLSSATKFLKVLPPTSVPLQAGVAPVQSVVRGTTPGQIVLPAVSLQHPQGMHAPLQVVSASPQFSNIQQPVHQVVNGQLQLAVPLQTTASHSGLNPMQQIVLLTNPPSNSANTSVNINQFPIGKLQVIPAINAKPVQQPQVIVTQSKPAPQPKTGNLGSSVTLPNKCIPVIFAPVSKSAPGKTEPVVTAAAKSQVSGKSMGAPRQLPLALHPGSKGKHETAVGLNRSTGQILYITKGDNQVRVHKLPLPSAKPKAASTKTKSSNSAQETKSLPKAQEDMSAKVMVNQETNTEDTTEKTADTQQTIVARKRKIAPRRKVKDEEEDEFRHRIVPDPEIDNPNVRRSSRIKAKPRKSYAEENSDENDDEEEEEEAETGAATQTDITEMEDTEDVQVEEGLSAQDESVEEIGKNDGDIKTPESSKRKSTDNNDPDFAPDEFEEKASDSDYEIDDEDDDDDDGYNFDKPSKAKKKRVKKYPEVSLQDHLDDFSVTDKPVEGDPDRKLYSCKMCNIGFSCISAPAMEEHLSKHLSGKFTCPHCDFDDVTGNLTHHISSQHPETLPISCSKCGNGFPTKERLRVHMSKVHKDYALSCEKCGKGFTYGRQLRRHMHKHHGEDILSCPKCGKLFSSKLYYKKHMKLKTDCVRRPCLCQECGCIVVSKHMLQEHRRRVHQKERNYMCNICSFTCFRMYQLREHMPVHTGEYPHKCPQCDFRAAKIYQVTSHMRTHTGKTPFKCDQCNYASRWNIQLRTHRLAHRSPYMVLCEPCGIAFKDERGLKLHQRKKHRPPGPGGDSSKDSEKEDNEDDEADGMDDSDHGSSNVGEDQNESDSAADTKDQDERSNSSESKSVQDSAGSKDVFNSGKDDSASGKETSAMIGIYKNIPIVEPSVQSKTIVDEDINKSLTENQPVLPTSIF